MLHVGIHVVGAEKKRYAIRAYFDLLNGSDVEDGAENGLVMLLIFECLFVDTYLLSRKWATPRKL